MLVRRRGRGHTSSGGQASLGGFYYVSLDLDHNGLLHLNYLVQEFNLAGYGLVSVRLILINDEASVL